MLAPNGDCQSSDLALAWPFERPKHRSLEVAMPVVRHVSAKDGDVLLLVGTNKGAFVFRSNAGRSRWDMGGPYFPGEPVYSMAFDGRSGRRRIFAGNTSWQWGPQLSTSDDFGKSWSGQDTQPIKFPEDTGATLKRAWQAEHAPAADTPCSGGRTPTLA